MRRGLLQVAIAAFVGGCSAGGAAEIRIPTADSRPLDLSGYEMSFEDDFHRPDVVAHGPFSAYASGMRWIAHTPWNGDFGDARFVDPSPFGPFGFGTDGLAITATRDPAGVWRSGLIASVDRDGPGQAGFTQRYGYFEMKAKFPPGLGTWPAFWLVGTDKAHPTPEVDVVEYYGKFPNYLHTTSHLWVDGKGVPDFMGGDHLVGVPDGSLVDRYNTYGVMITRETTTFFLNGASYLSLPTPPELDQPVYMLVNLALGGGWPTDGLKSPAVMNVAYVRAYREKGSTR